MKRYIKSSRRFYDSNGEDIIELDRETKSLTYQGTYDGDYYDGKDHLNVKFEDSNGNTCIISKVDDYNDNHNNPYGLEIDQTVQVSGYYVPQGGVADIIYYMIVQPRIIGNKSLNESNGIEIIAKYFYPPDAIDDAERLCDILDQNDIEYKYYGVYEPEDEDDFEQYPLQFNILKSGKSWGDIQRLVNSVRYAKPKKEKVKITRENGELRFRDIF